MEYKNLLTPVKVGSVTLKNRIVFAPMATHLADDFGHPTEAGIEWYAARARGGAGLIIPEAIYVSKQGRRGPMRLSLHDDSRIGDNQRIVDAVHKENAHIFAQLHHGGKTAPPEGIGEYPVGPSVIQYLLRGDIPWVGVVTRVLQKSDIERLIEEFVLAAQRAYRARYDGVCVHAAHGYLLSSFLSPVTNQRDDEYGGDIEGRTRIVRKIIESIRQVTPADYPVSVRMNVVEGWPWGYKENYAKEVAQRLEKTGADWIDFSAGVTEAFEYQFQPRWFQEGCLVPYIKGFKDVINVPVGIAGRIKNAAMAESIVENGDADLISIGRSFIADPDWFKKYIEKQDDEVNQCIGCNNCVEQIFASAKISCTVNPLAGRSYKLEDIPRAEPRKKVVVAGGGLAGMSFAKWACKRGHEVILFEKENQLGGQVLSAKNVPKSSELMLPVEKLQHDLNNLSVELNFGKTLTGAEVDALQPDILIVATGAEPGKDTIVGSGLPHVKKAVDILSGKEKSGKKVVVIGGGLIGASVSEFLAEEGHIVTMVKRSVGISPESSLTSRKMHTLRLAAYSVRILVEVEVLRITGDGVMVQWEKMNQEKEFINCDTVVMAREMEPELEVLKTIDSKNMEIYSIGDCVSPRSMYEAIKEGFELAVKV